MSATPPAVCLTSEGTGLILHLYIQPNASRDELVGLYDGELKVSVSAPPVDGASNTRLVKFLTSEFGVSKSSILLERGHTSRHKRIRIEGVQLDPPTSLPAVVQELLAAQPAPEPEESKPAVQIKSKKSKGKK